MNVLPNLILILKLVINCMPHGTETERDTAMLIINSLAVPPSRELWPQSHYIREDHVQVFSWS